jgi:SAM-dependent methyltransferase
MEMGGECAPSSYLGHLGMTSHQASIRNKRPSLNLGCGSFKIEGAFGLDRVQRGVTNVIADLGAGTLPFRDESFSTIYAYHVLEHLEIVPMMTELHRILVPGGRIFIRVPHATSFCFWDDPTHVRPFTSRTFDYWESGYHQEYGFKINFKIKNRKLSFLGNSDINSFKTLPWITNRICAILNRLANSRIRLCERLWGQYVGGFAEIAFELEKS